jgi:hypothetical protein
MNKYLALAALLGLTSAAKIPLKKKHLTYDSLMDLKERLEKVGYEKFSTPTGVENQE